MTSRRSKTVSADSIENPEGRGLSRCPPSLYAWYIAVPISQSSPPGAYIIYLHFLLFIKTLFYINHAIQRIPGVLGNNGVHPLHCRNNCSSVFWHKPKHTYLSSRVASSHDQAPHISCRFQPGISRPSDHLLQGWPIPRFLFGIQSTISFGHRS